MSFVAVAITFALDAGVLTAATFRVVARAIAQTRLSSRACHTLGNESVRARSSRPYPEGRPTPYAQSCKVKGAFSAPTLAAGCFKTRVIHLRCKYIKQDNFDSIK